MAEPPPDQAPPPRLKGERIILAAPEDPVEACLAAPAVRAFRNGHPEATIALTTPSSLAPLWDRIPEIDHVLPYSSRASANEIARTIRALGIEFNSSVAWEQSTAAKAFAKLQIGQRLGYQLPKLSPLLTDPLEFTQPFGPPEHRVRFYLGLVEKLGIEAMRSANFKPPALGPRPNSPKLAIAPGSEFGPAFRWPLDRFTEIALRARAEGWQLLVMGMDSAAPEAKALAKRLGTEARLLPDAQDLATVLHSLSGCSALLANDGVLPHLAAHLGIPAAILFGPGDPEVRRPLGRIHQLLNAHVACSPCRMSKCPLDHRCLLELTPDQVFHSLQTLLPPPPQ